LYLQIFVSTGPRIVAGFLCAQGTDMSELAHRMAKRVQSAIYRRKGPCAVFILPSGRHLICTLDSSAYQQAVMSYQNCWIGTYTMDCPTAYIAEDLSA